MFFRLESGSSSSSGIRLSLPYSKTTNKCIAVVSGSCAGRQFLKLLNVPTTEHDLFGLQSCAELLHNFGHVLFPFLSAQALQSPDPNIILKCAPVPIRQVSKFHGRSEERRVGKECRWRWWVGEYRNSGR